MSPVLQTKRFSKAFEGIPSPVSLGIKAPLGSLLRGCRPDIQHWGVPQVMRRAAHIYVVLVIPYHHTRPPMDR